MHSRILMYKSIHCFVTLLPHNHASRYFVINSRDATTLLLNILNGFLRAIRSSEPGSLLNYWLYCDDARSVAYISSLLGRNLL